MWKGKEVKPLFLQSVRGAALVEALLASSDKAAARGKPLTSLVFFYIFLRLIGEDVVVVAKQNGH